MSIADRGFASMDPAEVRKLARKGGQAAHARGGAHEWDKDEAAEAGRKGGLAAGITKRARRAKQLADAFME